MPTRRTPALGVQHGLELPRCPHMYTVPTPLSLHPRSSRVASELQQHHDPLSRPHSVLVQTGLPIYSQFPTSYRFRPSLPRASLRRLARALSDASQLLLLLLLSRRWPAIHARTHARTRLRPWESYTRCHKPQTFTRPLSSPPPTPPSAPFHASQRYSKPEREPERVHRAASSTNITNQARDRVDKSARTTNAWHSESNRNMHTIRSICTFLRTEPPPQQIFVWPR